MILLNLTKIFGYIISSRFKYVHYCQLSQGINTVYLSSPKCESGIEMIGIVLNISSGNSSGIMPAGTLLMITTLI